MASSWANQQKSRRYAPSHSRDRSCKRCVERQPPVDGKEANDGRIMSWCRPAPPRPRSLNHTSGRGKLRDPRYSDTSASSDGRVPVANALHTSFTRGPVAQNIYDQPEFFEKYGQLPRQLLGLEGAPEWPRIAALMPDLAGLEVVDLGCGMGWFTRWAAEHGAARVVGIDLSEKMIEEARARTPPSSIQYRLADLEHLRPLDGSFDFAYSSLAFHYVEDFKKLANQALREGSFFLFTIEHPIFMAARNPRWVSVDSDHRSWIVDSYAVEGERHTD